MQLKILKKLSKSNLEFVVHVKSNFIFRCHRKLTTNDEKMYSNDTYMPKKPTHGSKTSMNKSAAEFLIEVHFILLIKSFVI